MKTQIFLVYTLSLTLGLTFFYTKLREHFANTDHLDQQITYLKERVQEERFKHLLTSYEFQDFRQYVATLLPSAIEAEPSQEKNYPLRSLASVVQSSKNETFLNMRAKNILDEGKRHFRENNYVLANRSFHQVVQDFSYSPYVPEAMFLLVEGYFRIEDYSQAVQVANRMVEIYPDSELTGYSLLRVGKVYELQSRFDEAINIYKTLLRTFPQRDIASHARTALHAAEL